MEKMIDCLFDAILSHDADKLPMADRYRASENEVPAAVCHMTCMRTIVKINCVAHKIIDPIEGQVIVVANVDEGSKDSLFSARMKVVDDKITELEVGLLRSRAEAGFWYAPSELQELPKGWSTPIPEGGKATREELYELGHEIFQPTPGKMYFGSEDNFGMENGGVVREHIDYLQGMAPEGAPQIDPAIVPPSGRISMPLPMLFPVRPVDPKSRVLAVDEEQGLVAAYGVVPGVVSPYLVSDQTSTCFVPEAMIDDHRKTVTPEKMQGKSVAEEGKATGMTLQIMRFHSGKIQGIHQIITLFPYGSQSMWAE